VPDHVQTIVVGAGVIGLAIARHLARAGQEVLILEAESAIGQHCSSRNSQVIHAGIYYPQGSDSSVLCLRGRTMLYDYCATRHVDHARIGKLTLAATTDDLGDLTAICARGQANGVSNLKIISEAKARDLEPQIRCAGAMLSPSSGIIDAPGLMLSLLGEAENAGAVLALNAPFKHAAPSAGGLLVKVGDTDGTRLVCRNLINAAALGAWDVARGIKGLTLGSIPPRHLARGRYFSLGGRSPFKHLIYPMPLGGSLGVHSVQDLGGGVRFGPNMEWVDKVDYTPDDSLRARFETSVRRYWPGLRSGALQADTVGIRPRIWGPGEAKRSFEFQGAEVHGVKGLVQLFGVESPGLTSCLAIAERVFSMLRP